jgi:ubiquinone biosynthesis accessory factor UbiK
MWIIRNVMENKTSTSDSFIRFFEAALPEGLAVAVRENLRAAASSAFDKMDLVSNEEFEVQKRVLLRTRQKLEQLERQVAQLEKKLQK